MSRRGVWLTLSLAAAIGCGGDPGASLSQGPGTIDSVVAETSLHFLHAATTAPPLADRQVSFWAVKGENREIRLMYRPAGGGTDSVEFARFRVDAKSLANDTAGRPIPQGDSLLITLGIIDSLRLIVGFEPSGLVFSPSRPARLQLKFAEADPDLNGDQVVNAADTALIASLAIWKQEHAGDPWELVASSLDRQALEVDADIPGFTRFAVAY